ncbi:MAG: LamG-like jellyroll fold domain-containing protein [Verrucomicrobiota bacterium]|nr:LamG-like jellyroll fold domain-containing protein [Verrucomicrobiota bacterium]
MNKSKNIYSKTAFTLVEILVVILIIGTVLGIMLPTLYRAKQKGKYTRWFGYRSLLKKDSDCVLYYDFEEGQGTTINNYAHAVGRKGYKKNDYNGEVLDITDEAWQEGRWPMKKALHLDADATYVKVPFGKGLRIFKDITIMTWIKIDDVDAWQYLVDKWWWSGGHYRSWELRIRNGTLYWRLGTDTGTDPGGANRKITYNFSPYEGEWTHIAATFDTAGGMALYVNAEEVGTNDTGPTDGAFSTTKPIYLGVANNPENGSPHGDDVGLMDELVIFKRALTINEIKAHYNMGKP